MYLYQRGGKDTFNAGTFIKDFGSRIAEVSGEERLTKTSFDFNDSYQLGALIKTRCTIT